MRIQDELRAHLLEQGVSDVGFCTAPPEELRDLPRELHYTASLVVRLSDAIVDEITDAPTHTYFNHYRTVNAFLDQMLLRAGIFLERRGYRYLTVAASQSINRDGWNYEGRFSHKKAACLAGLGCVGRSSLFLHREWGPRVRLATLFTDCPFEPEPREPMASPCAACGRCVRACPAHAITGAEWRPGIDRAELFDPAGCSEHMKRAYQHIGRGAVCGVCMRVCPAGERQK